jgi:hypothetical protein
LQKKKEKVEKKHAQGLKWKKCEKEKKKVRDERRV